MQGDIALAGYMMTADEWKALDAPSRALLVAIAAKPEDLAQLGGLDAAGIEQLPLPGLDEVPTPMFAVGTAPITDEEATR